MLLRGWGQSSFQGCPQPLTQPSLPPLSWPAPPATLKDKDLCRRLPCRETVPIPAPAHHF